MDDASLVRGMKRSKRSSTDDNTVIDDYNGHQYPPPDYDLNKRVKYDGINPLGYTSQQTNLQIPHLSSLPEPFSNFYSSPTGNSHTIMQMDNSQHTYVPRTDISNFYGSSTISGNATVQLGNSQCNAGPGSTLYGPSMVAGDMNWHVNSAFFLPATEDNPTVALKKALYYQTMDNRKAQLDHVDAASFEWVWTETSFSAWLESDQGTYWISGKPASGKSTLMHHLVNDWHASERVKRHLINIHQSPVLIYFFFDFRAGSGIANTPEGMLRSLLLQLITNSKVVEQYVLQKCGHRLEGNWPCLEGELLDLICESLRFARLSVCGFIDGLDEYKGDLAKLVDGILWLQARSHMKLCLASRPEPIISFKLQVPFFSMQTHNSATIRAYTTAALSGFHQLMSHEEMQCMAQRIEKEANGVILWARFATDEAVGAMLQGCTMKEVMSRLESFPIDLKNFYERTLRRLDSTQKLQAAIIFFILEHWAESFSCDVYGSNRGGVALTDEILMLFCSRTWKKLGANTACFSGCDSTRFKLKVHVLLLGLVEFISREDTVGGMLARFVHKSLPAFLQNDEEFAHLAKRVGAVVDKRIMGPVFHAETIKMASEILVPDPSDYWTNVTGSAEKALDRLPESSNPKDIALAPFTVMQALACVDDYPILDEPEHLEWLLEATQTWFYRENRLSNHNGSFCSGSNKLEPDSVKTRNPELFDFMFQGCSNAFNHVVRNISCHLSEADRDLIFAYALSLPFVTMQQFQGTSHRFSALWRMLPVLLEDLCQGAHFLTLCIASSDMKIFDDIVSTFLAAGKLYNVNIIPSTWWIHQESHIMLCWIGSPFHSRCQMTQKKRLVVLLRLGLVINDPIYGGGNVMDALFDAELWGPDLFLPQLDPLLARYRRKLPHFSRAKFDVLIDAGFDLSNPAERVRLLNSAKQLLDFFYEKSVCQSEKDDGKIDEDLEDEDDEYDEYDEHEPINYEALIHDLEEHVIPKLESTQL